MEEKNLRVPVPTDVYAKIQLIEEQTGIIFSDYLETWIDEYYNWKDGKIMTEQTTILATVVPAELTARLERYLKEHDIKKKDFMIQIITRALEEAEADEN